MELFKKIQALFAQKPAAPATTSLCSDEEFLAYVAAPVRKRIEQEQAAKEGERTPSRQAA